MKGLADFEAEVDETFLFCQKEQHTLLVSGFELTKTAGVVSDAVVDTFELECQDGFGEVDLDVILEGGNEDLLLAPGIADAEGIEHQRDGKGAESFVVDGDKVGGIRGLATREGTGEIVEDALAEGVGEGEFVILEVGDNGLGHGIGTLLLRAVVGSISLIEGLVAVVEEELDEVALRGVDGEGDLIILRTLSILIILITLSILIILNILVLFLFLVAFQAIAVDCLGKLGGESLLGNIEQVGALGDILCALDEVGHQSYGIHRFLDEFGLADGVVLDTIEENTRLENNEVVLMGGQIVLQGTGAIFLGITVGILPIGEKDTAHVHSLRKEQVDGTECGLDTGRITIVKDGNIGGVAFNEAYLLGGERGAARGYGVFHTRLVHGDDVDITLNEITLIGLGYGRACLIEAVEDTTLVVDIGIGGIDILGSLFLTAKDAATKAQDTARDTIDGEHHTATETVVGFLGLFLEDGETRFLEDAVAITVLAGMVGEVAPLVETIAQAKVFYHLVAEAAAVEITETNGTSHLVVVEQVGEIFLCKLGDMEEGVALVLAFLLFLSLLLLLNLDVVFLRQPTQCFGVGVVLMLHEELHHIAGFAAAKTLEDTFRRRNIERRCLLVVEGAATYMVGSTLLE